MRADVFNNLPFYLRAELVWDNGELIDEETDHEGKHFVQVYSVRLPKPDSSQYAEVWYSKEKNRITDIKVLESDKDWQRYLDSLALEELY